MKIEVARILVAAAMDVDVDARLREDYSGRGMYGRTTAGVVVDDVDELVLLAATAVVRIVRGVHDDYTADDVMDFVEELRGLATDSMGRGVIIY